MAQKNLIIGGCTNYNINQLKPFVLSANEVAPEADKIMVVGNATEETREWLVENNFQIVSMPESNLPVHVLRFLGIYEFLKHHWNDYDYVVTTDVKDVYFQDNPFVEIENKQYEFGYKLVVASEGLKYKDESWGNENLMQAYGPYVYEQFKEYEIFNVGTFGGSAEYVKDMVFNIFTNSVNRPIAICDQAVFNVLINTQPYKDIICRTNTWACEAGTVADPSKINGFRANLLFAEPMVENGIVKNPDGTKFAIVHQYDRVPEWKEFVRKKYGQEDESEFFIYRV